VSEAAEAGTLRRVVGAVSAGDVIGRAAHRGYVEPAKGGARLPHRGAQSPEIALVEARLACLRMHPGVQALHLPSRGSPARADGFDQLVGLRQFLRRRGFDLECRTDRSGNVDAITSAPSRGTRARSRERPR
jgi:hypothetical protein